jgi:hypothetical protein
VVRFKVIKDTLCGRQQDSNLFRGRHGGILGLFENLPYTATMFQGLPRGLVEACAETGKRLQFLKLRIRQTKMPGDGTIGRKLCLSPNPGNRPANINSRKHALLKKVWGEVDLSVSNGDDIRGDVSRHILGLCLHDRHSAQRTPAQLLSKMGGPFKESGMNIEYVTGESFSARRSPEQQ